MEIAAFVVSCVAALISAGALWYSRGQKMAADRSAQAAERSAGSAERSEMSAAQSAEAAAETAAIERARRADEVADADRSRVRWSLEDLGKDRWMLTNAGTDSAYGVRVSAGDVHIRGNVGLDEFPSDHAEPYIILRTFGSYTDRIEVTWHYRADLSDEQQRRELIL
ncbi:hypothetical protein [Saccharomonospora saliphila]|uniref:hypothetical protein n=1 Tax=Saccharomonospora saliphila TaxID=369829 RepID=UPI00037CBA83|nr:hypothetical protein [Saccharomonospora saliphila]